jgi:hypothetical protein
LCARGDHVADLVHDRLRVEVVLDELKPSGLDLR